MQPKSIIAIMAVAVIFLSLTFQTSNSAQEITPTPAPSKTPSEDETSSTETPEATEEINTTQFEPLTQSDLNVLVGNVLRPNGAIWYNDNLYLACTGDSTLYEVDDVSGDTRTYIFGVQNAHAMYIEEIGENEINVWVPDYDSNALLRVNRAGAPQQVATELDNPWGISYLDENQFLVTNIGNDTLVLVNRDGTVTPILDELRSPTGIAVDNDYVYFANNGSARRSIEWLSVEDIVDETIQPIPQTLVSGLQNTTNIVMAEDGYLYFAYALGTRGVVGRIDPELCLDGGCTNDQVEVVVYTELAAPLAGLTISSDMRLFIHTIFRPEIYWLQLDTIMNE